jgi:hypothetical protein
MRSRDRRSGVQGRPPGRFSAFVASDPLSDDLTAVLEAIKARAATQTKASQLGAQRIGTRRGLKWGTPAMLLDVPYFYAAAVCTMLVNAGRPGWLHVLALLFVWDASKFL